MKHILEVCLVAFTLAGSANQPLAAQSSGQSSGQSSPEIPTLRPGISVEMAITRNALPMPDADNEDAFVVTVAGNGSVYLGTVPTTLAELAEKVRSTPFRRGQKLYIKADARASYATVLQVLAATNTGGIAPQVLLTGQSDAAPAGVITSPRGLDVMVGPVPPGSIATVVQLLNSGQQRPTLTINNDAIASSGLQSTLRTHFQKGDEKVVLLKADARLSFADVAQVVDACRAAGGTVFLQA